jgi:hypothetical protein
MILDSHHVPSGTREKEERRKEKKYRLEGKMEANLPVLPLSTAPGGSVDIPIY